MVRKIWMITQCGSTMAAGMTLSGLLHGRSNISTPSLIPPRIPKFTTCPWMTTLVSETGHSLKKAAYSEVLQAQPPRQRLHIRLIQQCPPTILSVPIKWKVPHFRSIRKRISHFTTHISTTHHDLDSITQCSPSTFPLNDALSLSNNIINYSNDAPPFFSQGDAFDDNDNYTDDYNDNDTPPHLIMPFPLPIQTPKTLLTLIWMLARYIPKISMDFGVEHVIKIITSSIIANVIQPNSNILYIGCALMILMHG